MWPRSSSSFEFMHKYEKSKFNRLNIRKIRIYDLTHIRILREIYFSLTWKSGRHNMETRFYITRSHYSVHHMCTLPITSCIIWSVSLYLVFTVQLWLIIVKRSCIHNMHDYSEYIGCIGCIHQLHGLNHCNTNQFNIFRTRFSMRTEHDHTKGRFCWR